MLEVFVDTSGWGNLADAAQTFHHLATTTYRAARQQRQKVVTTNYVLVEMVALLASPLRIPRATVVNIIEDIKASTFVEVVHVDVALLTPAQVAQRQRADSAVNSTAFHTRGLR